MDPKKVTLKIIRRDDLPLGIIDESVPSDVYHSVLNPAPTTSSPPSRTETPSRTEKPARTEETNSAETDSGIRTEENSDEKSEHGYNLRKRKSASQQKEEDYNSGSNSRTDKRTKSVDNRDSNPRTDEHESSNNSLRMATNWTQEEEDRLEYLRQLLMLSRIQGFNLTPMQMSERYQLQRKRDFNFK